LFNKINKDLVVDNLFVKEPKVYKYDAKQKILLRTFDSVQEAAKDANIEYSSIRKRIYDKINIKGE
jgi:hypothetical protein